MFVHLRESVICLALAVLLMPLSNLRADERRRKQMSNEMLSDCVRCMAALNYMKACFNRDKPDSADFVEEPLKFFTTLAYQASEDAGVSQKAVLAQLELFMIKYRDEMGNNCSNVSVITLSYAKNCKK